MKKKETSDYQQIIDVLQLLNKKFPTYNMGRHIATALDDYNDTWGISNKEFLFAINKYAAELDFDVIQQTDEEFLQKVMEDGEHLFDVVQEGDGDDIEYGEEF